MQTCYNCGKEVEDNVLICPDCGALVKRYDKPVRETEQEFSLNETEPQQERGGYVVRDAAGKLRLRGLLKVLCIIAVVLNFYFAFSQFLVLWLSASGDFFTGMLSEYSAFGIDQTMIDMMRMTVDFVGQNRIYILLVGSLFLIKAALLIWFMVSKRRLSLYAAGADAALLVLIFLFTGGGLTAFEYGLDMLVIFLLVYRHDWKCLPR